VIATGCGVTAIVAGSAGGTSTATSRTRAVARLSFPCSWQHPLRTSGASRELGAPTLTSGRQQHVSTDACIIEHQR
jgi:hypothetical protein